MRLERLEAAGFYHFSEPFRLDLRDLPDGLIAIVGPNGNGKTGLALDAALACLYGPGVQNKAFPSRDGTLFQYATARDAYLDASWNLEGRGTIRTRVNVDGVKRKAEAVLEEVDAAGIGHPVNNGLVATYRDAVSERFPSLRSLLASAYAAQNKRGGFGELGQKERVELFVELADLAHLEEKAATARRCQQIADGIAARMRAALDVVLRDATPEERESLAHRLDEKQQERRRLGALFVAAEAASVDAKAIVERAASDAQRYTAAAARRDELDKAVRRARATLSAHDADAVRIDDAHREELANAVTVRDAALAAIERHRGAATQAHEKSQADRRTRITNNRAILADAASIRAAAQRLIELETELQDAQRERDASSEREHAVRGELADARETLAESQVAVKRIADATGRAQLLGQVKFGVECGVEPACPLVTDAVAARELIATLMPDAKVCDVRAERVDVLMRYADAWRERIKTIGSRVAELMQETARLKLRAALAPHLDNAEQKIAEYERDCVEAERANKNAMHAYDEQRAEAIAAQVRAASASADRKKQRVFDSGRRRAELASELDAALKEHASAERTVQELADALTAATSAARAYDTARQLVTDLTAAIARLDVEQVDTARRLQEVEDRMVQAGQMRHGLRLVEDEALAWTVLAKACGRDGVQRLEIDAAGPAVSDIANQLLQVGYGTRFTIDIVTQVATAKGDDLKEKFTILAIDNDNGGEPRDIGDLSGGERVVLEEAVRAALSCYVNLRSRQPCRTIWRDETLGALDPDNASRYIAMLRKLQEISGVQQILFVTHNLAAARLADAQVRVRNGQATTALPPYSEEAA